MDILILCTGNSCRSQMAEAILRSFDPGRLRVHSAGTAPASKVHPMAIEVMEELGIDLNKHYPKHVDDFTERSFDYVITVCGGAKESCPIFSGKVQNRQHIGFDDPAEITGNEEQIRAGFRQVRDQILSAFYSLYHREIKPRIRH